MKRQVLLEIKSLIDSNGEKQEIDITTHGNLLCKDSAVFVSYKETQQNGFDGCTVLVKVEGEDRVSVGRSGGGESQLIIEKGKRNLCSYGTPYGMIMMGVTCASIKNALDNKGLGELSFSYELDVNMQLVSKNQLFIKIRESKN